MRNCARAAHLLTLPKLLSAPRGPGSSLAIAGQAAHRRERALGGGAGSMGRLMPVVDRYMAV
jgi:hypothetical protein